MRVTAKRAMERLGISYPTFDRWVLRGRIKQYKKPVGERIYFEYSVKQIDALKKKMDAKRKPGHPYIQKR